MNKTSSIALSLLTCTMIGTPLSEKCTFDDVLIAPRYSTILPNDAVLKTKLTKNISLNIPIISAAMDTVTESRLAVALAQDGGIGIIHKNLNIEEQVSQVEQVKKFENGMIKNPITVKPHTHLHELASLMQKFKISGVPVVEEKNQLVGIVTNRDVRFETDLYKTVSEVMTPKNKLVTVTENASHEQIMHLFSTHRIEKLLVINDEFQLTGIITLKDIKNTVNKNACKDAKGRLRVGAAIGVRADSKERVAALARAEVDVIVIDNAHGHSSLVIEMLQWIKKEFPHIDVIAGNIATGPAAIALAQAGADAVKVGIGPGSICTTRIITGVGVPQISAIMDVAAALQGSGVPIIADGGMRYSGDICKALVAGADTVMLGSLFAGTEEAPGETELHNGRAYKTYHGMHSIRSKINRYGNSEGLIAFDKQKIVPEGIEARVPYKGSVHEVIFQLVGGIRSCMRYTGCNTIGALHTDAEFIRITGAGMRESHSHDVHITKEAPNYHK